MIPEKSWPSGRVLEIGADGFGYIVDESEPARSHPFHVSKLSHWDGRLDSLEGAAVRYLLRDHRVIKVELAQTLITN